MPMNLKQMIKSKLFEVEQPQSEGEKNFKALHRAVNHKNLVPGITDQDHIFNGSTKPYDNKHNVGYKPGEDRAAYDKTLKLDDKETDNGYETAKVEEAIGSMIESKGTHKNIQRKASFSSSNVTDMIRKEKQTKAAEAAAASMKKEEIEQVYEKNWIKDAVGKPGALTMAAKRAGMSNAEYEKKHMHDSGVAGKRSRLAMTLKNLHKEEIESLDEAKWMEKDLPGRNYNKDGYSEKGDIHHIEVHPELLKKHAIIHQVTHDGEYGPTHHFEHPTHGKVAVYQSGLNKKSGNPIISVRTYGPQGAKPVAHEFAGMFKGKTMHVYNESVNENYDDTPEEVSMVRTELKAIVADAQSLLDNMPSDMHIEPWVQSKIAVAKSMVNGVHDYMLYSDDDDKPSDKRSPMPSMSNPFSTNEENDLDEKLSPEQLKKFAKLAPPYDKITHADKIVAVKKKEAGQKVLPEASAIERHAMNMARQAMRRLKPEMKHTMHTKMNTPKDKLNMNKGDK